MTPHRLHPAWVVLIAVTVCMLAATGVRAVFGIYIKPMEAEMGWTRSGLSGAAAVSLLLLGAVGPWAGRIADRWGTRRLIIGSLILLGVGTIAMGQSTSLWQVYVTAGVLMAVGAGGLGMATGSVIAARWFDQNRGMAVGISAGGMSAGQLLVIPLATFLTTTQSWRVSTTWLGAGLFVVILPIALLLVWNDPADRGVRPYGASTATPLSAEPVTSRDTARMSAVGAARS